MRKTKSTIGGIRIGDAWFRSLAETASTGIAVYDLDRFYYVNPALQKFTGQSEESLLATPPLELVSEEYREDVAARIAARLSSGGQRDRYEVPMLAATGVRWVELSADAVDLGGRRVSLGTLVDITDRRRAERALREEKERAEITLASLREGVIRTDGEGKVDYLNPVAERLTGYSLDEAAGRPLSEVWRVVDEATRLPLVRRPSTGGAARVPATSGVLTGRRGDERLVEGSVAPLGTGGEAACGAVLVFRDVTELRRLERRMSFLATHDPLTGLVNRDELDRRLRRAVGTAGDDRAGEHALCMIELDGLAVVNDTLGRTAGDELMRCIASVLSEVVLPGDTVARIAGGELAVLISDAPRSESRELAERMRAAVADFRFEWRGATFDPRLSIGLVPLCRPGLESDQILSAATTACAAAQRDGGDRVHEIEADDPSVDRRRGEMEWVHRIQRALDEDRFLLYRQRIERLAEPAAGESHRPLSELLLRVAADDGDVDPPGALVAAAERHKLIGALDRWVVRHGLATLAARLAAGKDAPDTLFCINISGMSLGDESFLDFVVQQLEESGLDPRNLGFEITETAAVQHLSSALRFISILTGMGSCFVLDDFGSGLSSFAYLRNLQVGYLKISAQFVHRLAEDRLDRELVTAIHRMATVLDIPTIAEGVETEATLEALREIGVELAQGYLLSRPRPL